MMPQDNQVNRKPLIIAGAAAAGLIVIIIIVVAVVSQKHGTANTGATPTPGTGASANPAAPTPSLAPTPTPSDSAKAQTPQTQFANFDNLISQGVTSNQEDDMRYAFTKFGGTSGQDTSMVTINSSTIQHTVNHQAGGATFTFDVELGNGTVYHVTAQLASATSADVVLTNVNGKRVYDSGTIDLYNGIGDN